MTDSIYFTTKKGETILAYIQDGSLRLDGWYSVEDLEELIEWLKEDLKKEKK